MSSFNIVPDYRDAKAQLEYERSRSLKADRRQHSSRPSHPNSLSSSPNTQRGAWRRSTPAAAKHGARSLSSAPNLYDAWDDEVARAHDQDVDNYSDSDVPEATWDSSSETEDMELEPALLSDFILPQTEASGMLTMSRRGRGTLGLSYPSLTDFVTISEHYLAKPTQHFQCPFSPSPTSPMPHSPSFRDTPMGPGLGLPEDGTVWVEDHCYSSTASSEPDAAMDLGKFYSKTVIIIQDSVW